MDSATYLCITKDNTTWVVSFDAGAGKCTLQGIADWINQKPATLEGGKVYNWAEEIAPQIEAIFPYHKDTESADFRESEILEISELMDDIRDFWQQEGGG